MPEKRFFFYCVHAQIRRVRDSKKNKNIKVNIIGQKVNIKNDLINHSLCDHAAM